MTKAKNPRKLLPFDAARYLTDDAAIAEYSVREAGRIKCGEQAPARKFEVKAEDVRPKKPLERE